MYFTAHMYNVRYGLKTNLPVEDHLVDINEGVLDDWDQY